MAVKTTIDYVPISSKHRPGTKLRKFRGVTVHETDNTSYGADARAHRNYYMNISTANSGDSIGYHWFVDDIEAYLMHPEDEIAWTNGDGHGDGNYTTVSVEICVNKDGNKRKARKNAQWLVADILYRHGIKRVIGVTGRDAQGNKDNANLFQHRSWMVKECPRIIRKFGLWKRFVKRTQKELDKMWTQYGKVVGDVPAPCRWKAKVDSKIKGRFAVGSNVEILKKVNDNWYKVKGKNLKGKTISGFVYRKRIRVVK